MELLDKIAVVSGATSGLGKAMVTSLIEKGCKVYGLARTKTKLLTLQEELGTAFIPVEMDITDKKAIEKWGNITFSDTHLPDILINNAGVGGFAKIDETSVEMWLNMMNTNLNGTYYLTHQLVPFFKQNKLITHIINIGSILGSMGREEGAAYCATKHAISGFSDALFKELRKDNIKVTLINPGSIDTDFFQTSGIEKHSNMLQAEDLAKTIVHVLETPDNFLINEITIRPLNPKKPD